VESATDLWQRAVTLEADRREALRRNNGRPRKNHELPSDGHRLTRAVGGSEKRIPISPHNTTALKAPRTSDSIRLQLRRYQPNLKHDGDGTPRSSLETSNRIFKEWQHQIKSEESGVDRCPSFTTHIYAAPKSRMIPASWAKWPSHNRLERSGPANQKDAVTQMDFGLPGATPQGSMKWPTDQDRANTSGDRENKMAPRASLSTKFGRAFRGSITKMMARKDSPSSNLDSSTEGNVKPQGSDGYLDYPELELLPMKGGRQELQNLKPQVGHIKHDSISTVARQRCPSHPSAKTPMGLRIAKDVHDIQHSTEFPNLSIKDFLTTSGPNTPALVRSRSLRDTSDATQHFCTPMTHVSYDDCVPKYMLDGNNSVKSDSTVMVKRSKSSVEHKKAGMVGSNTWSGRVRPQSLVLKRAEGFDSDLEKMLVAERDNIVRRASVSA
jgi:hypothetical protein